MSLVAFLSFDLGGALGTQWERLLEALKSAGFTWAARFGEFDEALQTSFRYMRPPVLAIEEGSARLDFDLADRLHARTAIRIYPTGVIGVRYDIQLPARSTVTTAFDVRTKFMSFLPYHYHPYLSARLEQRLDKPPGGIPAHDGGIDVVEKVERIRDIAGAFIDRRGCMYWPTSVRFAMVIDYAPEGRRAVSRWVKEFAGHREVPFPKQSLDTIEVDTAPVNCKYWPEAFFASCDDNDILMVVGAKRRARALACAELGQQMWFLSRTWIEVLERTGLVDPEGTRTEQEIKELEQGMLDVSATEHRISGSMIELDSATIMFRDPWSAQVVAYCYAQFQVDKQRELVFQRLAAIDRHHGMVASVVDRWYQGAARKQAELLQYVFAGAVAAQLMALVLAIIALSGQPKGVVTAVTVVGLALLWAALVAIAVRLSPIQIVFGSGRKSGDPSQRGVAETDL